jgi:predicted nucleic acid-binding protein
VIVVDSSAMTELVLETPRGRRVEARLFRDGDELHAPHLMDVEVLRAVRRYVLKKDIDSDRAEQALLDLVDFRIHRHEHFGFLWRAWQLRHNLAAYDAMYVVLAEALDATVVTCDGPLGDAPGHLARVEVIR